jgi:hypothetical protein
VPYFDDLPETIIENMAHSDNFPIWVFFPFKKKEEIKREKKSLCMSCTTLLVG